MKRINPSIVLGISAALLIAGFTSCASIPDRYSTEMAVYNAITSSVQSIEKAAEEITPEEEYYIGRSVAASISTTYPVDHGSYQMTSYLNRICETLVMNSERPYLYRGYYVVILDTDEINAMATPGGHIFISRGLIDCTSSEDELAAVLAHEIAHIQLGHSVQAIKASRVRSAVTDTTKAVAVTSVATIGTRTSDYITYSLMEEVMDAVNSIYESTNEVVKTLVNTGFSKDQEFEADKQALYILQNAGYDPYAMLDMLEQIESSPSNTGWGATHPSPKDRIKKVKKELSSMKVDQKSGRQIRTERFETEYQDYKIFEID